MVLFLLSFDKKCYCNLILNISPIIANIYLLKTFLGLAGSPSTNDGASRNNAPESKRKYL